MIRRPPRSTLSSSSAASDVYKRQVSTQSTGSAGDNVAVMRKLLVWLVAWVLLASGASAGFTNTWRSPYHLVPSSPDKVPSQESSQNTWFDPELSSFSFGEMPSKEYGVAVASFESNKDMFLADRKHHLIWQLRQGRVFKIFGNKNSEAGLKDGDVDDEEVVDGNEILFDSPYELHTDSASKVIYVAESRSRIRKLVFVANGGVNAVRIVAGNGRRGHRDGDAKFAMFGYPLSMATASGILYVTDYSNHCIRKIVQSIDGTGVVSTLVGTPLKCGRTLNQIGLLSTFERPHAIAVPKSTASELYLFDNHTSLRTISLSETCTLPDALTNVAARVVAGAQSSAGAQTGGVCAAHSGYSGPHSTPPVVQRGFECQNAIDSDANTAWVPASNQDTPWMQISLAKPSRLYQISVRQSELACGSVHNTSQCRRSTLYPWRVLLQFSDQSNQTIQLNQTSALHTYQLQPVHASWVKLTILKRHPALWSPVVPAHTSQRSTCAHNSQAVPDCGFFKATKQAAAPARSTVAIAEVHLLGTDCGVTLHELRTLANTAGTRGMQDGNASRAMFDRPVHMSFHASNDLYIADSANGVLRKYSNGIVSTVVGEPTPGETKQISGLGVGLAAAVIKTPKGQPVNKIGFTSQFTRPTTALVASDDQNEKQLLSLDAAQSSRLFVLDVVAQTIQVQCASNNGSQPSQCSQTVI
eukprot:TRINITY_DN1083_c0_g1_i5.p1 TRINITY_DN1083_c0_g1~~TRINITY_DN1083_c0_g1_i5.p1  ORF type:complete len:698 (-),score=169.35 TRINITY_DN1083_c0_g1_i5:100-2193(-)